MTKRQDWQPTPAGRWVELGLLDPDHAPAPADRPPSGAFLADMLLWALAAPGAEDPVEGIVEGVRLELSALAEVVQGKEKPLAELLRVLDKRLEAAVKLLRWADNREQMPVDAAPLAEPPLPGSALPATE